MGHKQVWKGQMKKYTGGEGRISMTESNNLTLAQSWVLGLNDCLPSPSTLPWLHAYRLLDQEDQHPAGHGSWDTCGQSRYACSRDRLPAIPYPHLRRA